MSIMGFSNTEIAATMLFKRSIILKLNQLFTQYDKREIEFYVIVNFIKDNKIYL